MVREIVHDEEFLSLPSFDAGREDSYIIEDLVDTLTFHESECVGMAANMIGERKSIIIVSLFSSFLVMINPVIVSRSGEYVTEEGCLSLKGTRECTRYRKIEVEYLDRSFTRKKGTFSGFTAEIIQHEIDHLGGILI